MSFVDKPFPSSKVLADDHPATGWGHSHSWIHSSFQVRGTVSLRFVFFAPSLQASEVFKDLHCRLGGESTAGWQCQSATAEHTR